MRSFDLSMLDPSKERFTLGDWIVDAAGNRLIRGEESRPLRNKAMALLVLLARHGGETVSREEIVKAVWDGNEFVAPKAINTAIWTIRQALDDDHESPRYVETVAKKGYRLIAPVAAVSAVAATSEPTSPLSDSPPADVSARALRSGWIVAVLLAVAVGAALRWGWLQSAVQEPTLATLASASPLTQEPGLEYLGQLSPDTPVCWPLLGGKGGVRVACTCAPQRIRMRSHNSSARPTMMCRVWRGLPTVRRLLMWLRVKATNARSGSIA